MMHTMAMKTVTMKDFEIVDTYMVASMVARNIESINELMEEVRKLKKRLIKTNQLLRNERKITDDIKVQIKLLKKNKNIPKN